MLAGREFQDFNLDKYTQIGGQGTPTGNRTVDFYATGSTVFDVSIDDNHNVHVDYDQNFFKFSGVNQISEKITFHIRGCSDASDDAVFTVMNQYPDDGTQIVSSTGPAASNTCALVVNGVDRRHGLRRHPGHARQLPNRQEP